MHWLAEFYKWHPTLAGGIAALIATNLIGTMPSPDQGSGKLYRWLFAFLHSINIPRLLATAAPQAAKFAEAVQAPPAPITAPREP
jgi:hypothetical protein